jgi:hypothetical protein
MGAIRWGDRRGHALLEAGRVLARCTSVAHTSLCPHKGQVLGAEHVVPGHLGLIDRNANRRIRCSGDSRARRDMTASF